jgi:hypothetical protein
MMLHVEAGGVVGSGLRITIASALHEESDGSQSSET